MSEIRAFVGHSFTDNDSHVVGKFLKYFDQLSDLYPRFSWVHAEPAEPKFLAEKVMSLLADRNVFIGICTKKERVVQPHSLTRILFRPGLLKVQVGSLSWKTSDWIIQEIGLARGKNLQLILLVERGVRQPGGLQGDMEYIPFDRGSPEQSFGKLLEMVTALSAKVPARSVAPPDTSTLPMEADAPTETSTDSGDSEWNSPQPDWTRVQYEIAFMIRVRGGDSAAGTAISTAYLTTADAAEGENSATWEAFTEYFCLGAGNSRGFIKLKELAKKYPTNTEILRYLGFAFEKYEDYATAARTYETAADQTINDNEILGFLGLAAVAYARAGTATLAWVQVEKMKEKVEANSDGEPEILNTLRQISEIMNDKELTLAVMERAVEVDPSDADLRFSLAYKHGESENNDLSLYRYLRIPKRGRKPMTWNNLGVAFDHFSLVGKSVTAYRQAEQLGETLAMSNLALKLISAGFLTEAREHCDRALSIDNYHMNVGYTLARLQQTPNDEETKEAELLKNAKPKSEFYQEFGRAVCRSQTSNLAENWEGPDCVLKLSLSEGRFKSYRRILVTA